MVATLALAASQNALCGVLGHPLPVEARGAGTSGPSAVTGVGWIADACGRLRTLRGKRSCARHRARKAGQDGMRHRIEPHPAHGHRGGARPLRCRGRSSDLKGILMEDRDRMGCEGDRGG